MRGGTVQINWHDTKPVLTLDFHPTSGSLATGGADFDIKLWLLSSGDAEKNVPSASYQNSLSYHGSAVNALRFSPCGDQLASGADGGELILWKLHSSDASPVWKLHSSDASPAWKVLKTLSFHRKDVLDLRWSADGAFLISGSVDNSCIIWDVNKGSVHQILDAHFHYVQGVAFDPLAKYAASLSSDRTCRIYVNKPQAKTKGIEKMNYVCQHVITKVEPQMTEDSKVPIKSHQLLNLPALLLPGASKPVVAVCFCPVTFSLRGSTSSAFFKLPYCLIFAVATLNSLYIYDTESIQPIAIMAGLHYAAITDISWSPTGKCLALSSQDGYCTLVEFDDNELGSPISLSEKKVLSNGNKIPLQKPEEMATIEAATNKTDIVGDSKKAEVQKSDGEQASPSLVSTPVPNKPAKRRITPMAID
ncbi:hypothetical protein RJ639_016239 [Escallonia herrerae]|uniref:CAF1B/HIR1 beta-propeller domain-containing protein n=1 Tax=Escallonia herrerae TaxID=1293975 RepID=A0AA88VE97_9ASTE|nr:hypothetical protein RJ639_016239 [Escallonia herrerae]